MRNCANCSSTNRSRAHASFGDFAFVHCFLVSFVFLCVGDTDIVLASLFELNRALFIIAFVVSVVELGCDAQRAHSPTILNHDMQGEGQGAKIQARTQKQHKSHLYKIPNELPVVHFLALFDVSS